MNLAINRNFVQSLSLLIGMTCLLNCLLMTYGHVFILDLRFCWINTFQCLPLFQVIPNHHG